MLYLKLFLLTELAPSLFARVSMKLGYFISNICLACVVCNRIKSNFFNHDEFIEISQKYIKPKLQKFVNRGTRVEEQT